MYEIPFHKGNLSQKSFLVTGGAGFIGSNIVEYLLKYKAKKVRVLDNFSTGSYANIEEFKRNTAFELIEGDIRDINLCRKVLKGINYVTHQAALGSVPRSINDPITSNDVNVSGFLNVIVAAREADVKRMVYAASSSTYGDHPDLPKIEDKIGSPLSPYAVTKMVNELYASVFSKSYDFHTIGLRYFNVFGPKQNPKGPYAAVIPIFIESALKLRSPFINGDGETSRDFTFVENAVQANIKAMLLGKNKEHNVFNVACNESTSLNNLWKMIAEMGNVNLEPVYKESRKGDIRHSLANLDKIYESLKYKPLVSVNEGLNITYEWYKNYYQHKAV